MEIDQIVSQMRYSTRYAAHRGQQVEGPPEMLDQLLDEFDRMRGERGDLMSELRDEQQRVRDCSAELRDLRWMVDELRKLRTDLAAAHDRDQNAVARRMDSISGFKNW